MSIQNKNIIENYLICLFAFVGKILYNEFNECLGGKL